MTSESFPCASMDKSESRPGRRRRLRLGLWRLREWLRPGDRRTETERFEGGIASPTSSSGSRITSSTASGSSSAAASPEALRRASSASSSSGGGSPAEGDDDIDQRAVVVLNAEIRRTKAKLLEEDLPKPQRISDELAGCLDAGEGEGAPEPMALVISPFGKVWRVEVGRDSDGAFLGRGWAEFMAAHGVDIGWFVCTT